LDFCLEAGHFSASDDGSASRPAGSETMRAARRLVSRRSSLASSCDFGRRISEFNRAVSEGAERGNSMRDYLRSTLALNPAKWCPGRYLNPHSACAKKDSKPAHDFLRAQAQKSGSISSEVT
jgi:hypothetical protein